LPQCYKIETIIKHVNVDFFKKVEWVVVLRIANYQISKGFVIFSGCSAVV
jgi:hypothetical protein